MRKPKSGEDDEKETGSDGEGFEARGGSDRDDDERESSEESSSGEEGEPHGDTEDSVETYVPPPESPLGSLDYIPPTALSPAWDLSALNDDEGPDTTPSEFSDP